MPIQTRNKTTVPVNSDPYALTADLKTAVEGLNAPIPVADAAERDALPSPFEGMTVVRLDQDGQLDKYIGGAWTGVAVEYGDPLAVSGFTVSGPIMLERKGGRKVLTVNVTVNRTAGAFSVGSSTFTNLGPVIPAALRLDAGTQGLYLSNFLTGNGMNQDAQTFINPVSGEFLIRGTSTFNWLTAGLCVFHGVFVAATDGI